MSFKNLNGFSLLELMITLAILSLLVSIIIPKVARPPSELLQHNAENLLIRLQEIADYGLIYEKDFIVSKDQHNRWLLWERRGTKWQQVENVYDEQPNWISQIQTKQTELQEIKVKLQFPSSILFAFFANGRYSSFNIVMTEGDQVLNIIGDGVNDLQL